MLFYPAALLLSRQTLDYTAGIIRRHRRQIGSPWRKLNPARQALLVLAYLRKGTRSPSWRPGSASAPPPPGVASMRRWRCWRPDPRSCARRCGTPRTPGTPTWSSTAP